MDGSDARPAPRSGIVALGLAAAEAAGRALRRHRAPAGAVPVSGAGLGSDGWDEFRRELDRSRRYEREFVLIRIRGGDLAANGRHAAAASRVDADRLWRISAFLRSVDRAWYSNGSIYVLLPESDRARGEGFLNRIRDQAPEVLPAAAAVMLAAFPADGLTSGAILAALDGNRLAGGRAPERGEDADREVPADVHGELGLRAEGSGGGR